MPIIVDPIEPLEPPALPAGCEVTCPPECSWIFSRLRIFPTPDGETQVQWSLHPNFTAPGPYDFKLQWGSTGNPAATDWVDVTGWLPDTYVALDSRPRMHGRFQFGHYRVLVQTSAQIYASAPQSVLDTLSPGDWTIARNLLSQEYNRLTRMRAGADGYLLKRRHSGTLCSCVDPQTRECRNPQHLDCYGTGILGGYYAAISCFFVEARPTAIRSHQRDTGTTNEGPTMAARMINVPQVFSYDVWVNKNNGTRWAIHTVKVAAEVRGVALILDPVEMRLLPFSNVVYNFPVG